MDYHTVAEILNRHILEGNKRKLLTRIADSPERYIGLFRPTKPRAKILQNLLQSQEIRFGDAMEELFLALLADLGYTLLPERIQDAEGNDLSIDLYFTDGETFYFVEQKVRDDHDSTKKRGQVRNFELKLDILQKIHGDHLAGIMYFIDPDLTKNRKYYLQELEGFETVYSVKLHLLYGSEFPEHLGHPGLWADIIDWLSRWKESLPDLPETNFDLNPQESFREIQTLEPRYWRRLITNDELWEQGIIQVIFQDGSTLRMVHDFFEHQDRSPYQALAALLSERLNRYYPTP